MRKSFSLALPTRNKQTHPFFYALNLLSFAAARRQALAHRCTRTTNFIFAPPPPSLFQTARRSAIRPSFTACASLARPSAEWNHAISRHASSAPNASMNLLASAASPRQPTAWPNSRNAVLAARCLLLAASWNLTDACFL
jgi:hypothetical protein